MKTVLNAFWSLLLSAVLVLGSLSPALAAEAPSAADVRAEATKTAEYMLTQVTFDESIKDASNFYTCARILILAMRTDADTSSAVPAFLEQAKNCLSEDGSMDTGCPLVSQAMLLMVLALNGTDAADWDGINVVKGFEDALSAASAEDLAGLNPYFLPYLYQAADAYADQLSDADALKEKVADAVAAKASEEGLDLWGGYPSVDDNGLVLSGLSGEPSLADTAAKAVSWSEAQMGENGQFISWGQASVDSGAAALALFSTYGNSEAAAQAYEGLLALKDASTPGRYGADSWDPNYATADALFGLVTYERVLSGQTNPFDVSDMLPIETEEPSTEESMEESTEEATEESTEETAEETTEAATEESQAAEEETQAHTEEETQAATEAPSTQAPQTTASSSEQEGRTKAVETGDPHLPALFAAILVCSGSAALLSGRIRRSQ